VPWLASAEQPIVAIDHQPDQLVKAASRPPAKLRLRLGRIADQMINLRGALQGLVNYNVVVGIHAGLVERDLQTLPHQMRLGRCLR
jgi:hypothetical protein